MTLTILVVDDSPDVLLLCRVHLEYEGYQVVTAGDGYEALERIAEARPELVLLDVMMPGMDGWEVLASIKGNVTTCHIAVVMLTARGASLDEIRGWRAGASGYVTKPFNPATLSGVIKETLSLSSGEMERIRRGTLKLLRVDQRLSSDVGPVAGDTPR